MSSRESPQARTRRDRVQVETPSQLHSEFLRATAISLMVAAMSSRLSDYDYVLPEHLVAHRPLPRREDSRMMVLHRNDQSIEHRMFADFESYLRSGDLVVLNNTRVLPARRFSDDGKIEFLFLERLEARR